MKFTEKKKIHKILRILSIITAHYFIVLRADSWLKYCILDPEKLTSNTTGRRNINISILIRILHKQNDKVKVMK